MELVLGIVNDSVAAFPESSASVQRVLTVESKSEAILMQASHMPASFASAPSFSRKKKVSGRGSRQAM